MTVSLFAPLALVAALASWELMEAATVVAAASVEEEASVADVAAAASAAAERGSCSENEKCRPIFIQTASQALLNISNASKVDFDTKQKEGQTVDGMRLQGYALYSKGKACVVREFVWHGRDEHCRSRCTKTSECLFFTTYSGGWCQLSAQCASQRAVRDTGAKTYQKQERKKVAPKTPDPHYTVDLFKCGNLEKPDDVASISSKPGKDPELYMRTVRRLFSLRGKLKNRQQQQDFSGCLVRFAGHDFMDFRFLKDGKSRGGSDACVAHHAPGNAGLVECLKATGVIDDWGRIGCKDMSLADYMVIAAEAATAASSEIWSNFKQSGSLEVQFLDRFEFGRKTVAKCPWAATLIPLSDEGCYDNKRIFVDHIFLSKWPKRSWKKTTAIFGAHTLGQGKAEVSGFDVKWTPDPWVFNNQYYKAIVGHGWGPDRSANGKEGVNMWVNVDGSPNRLKMMNSDLCLVYDNSLDSVNCDKELLKGSSMSKLDSKGRLMRNVFCQEIRGRGRFLNAKERMCCSWARPDKMYADPMDEWHAKNDNPPEDLWKPLPALYKAGKTNVHCGGAFTSAWNASKTFGNFRHQCCQAIKNHDEAGRDDLLDCDYRGNLEAPGWEWAFKFSLDETLFFEEYVAAWNQATSNNLHYSQDPARSMTYFKSNNRPNCGCCRIKKLVYGDEGYEECEQLKKEDTYDPAFWSAPRGVWPLSPLHGEYDMTRPTIREKMSAFNQLGGKVWTTKWGDAWNDM